MMPAAAMWQTHKFRRREAGSRRRPKLRRMSIEWINGMLTISEAQQRTELFLTGQMLEALRAVEYELPSFDTQLHDVDLAAVARAHVEIRHVRGASDATYLINAFGEELLMQLQLNVHRLVVVYRVPALDALDAGTLAVRLERWRIGAEHAGWKFGWRDSPIAGDPGRRFVETYCYAFAGTDFSRRRAAAALLAHGHCSDDPLLHDRGSPRRHSPLTPPRWIPGVNQC
jgi:hypothetical protein